MQIYEPREASRLEWHRIKNQHTGHSVGPVTKEERLDEDVPQNLPHDRRNRRWIRPPWSFRTGAGRHQLGLRRLYRRGPRHRRLTPTGQPRVRDADRTPPLFGPWATPLACLDNTRAVTTGHCPRGHLLCSAASGLR